jgi:restriction endonuclease Mrr
MRLRQIADLLRRARAHKSVNDIPLQRVASPGRQFAVGKRTRAALAELHVRILIQRTSRPKPCNRRVTRVHVLPALEDESLVFAEEEELPAGYRPGEIVL